MTSTLTTSIDKMNAVIFNKETITTESIHAFNPSSKGLNDKNNKTRENVVAAIINGKIPNEYYELPEWNTLHTSIREYIQELDNTKKYIRAVCTNKGGRKFNYDFNVVVYYEDGTNCSYNIELKFNASSIDETPQFVSPMKPSQYMSSSYEDYYYDNYLTKLAAQSGLEMPPRETYLKQIHTNSPKCMAKFQELYYKGC